MWDIIKVAFIIFIVFQIIGCFKNKNYDRGYESGLIDGRDDILYDYYEKDKIIRNGIENDPQYCIDLFESYQN